MGHRHSTGVTGSMRPPPDIVDRFVWQPLSEFAMPFVFAFGREWDTAAKALDLPCVRQLGRGGEDYGSLVASRSVRVYELPSGQRLVVEWHSGSAGPPNAIETGQAAVPYQERSVGWQREGRRVQVSPW